MVQLTEAKLEHLRLDLACGETPAQDYQGVDKYPVGDTKWICDLDTYPWSLNGQPLPDESCDALYCSHFVEHVEDLVAFMDECWRVLVPRGTLTIRHPYQFSVWAWQDPTHRRALNEYTWAYFDRGQREHLHIDHYVGTKADFEVDVRPSVVETGLEAFPYEEILRRMHHEVNIVHELTAILTKR